MGLRQPAGETQKSKIRSQVVTSASPDGSFSPLAASSLSFRSLSTRIWPNFSGLSRCHKIPLGLGDRGVVRMT